MVTSERDSAIDSQKEINLTLNSKINKIVELESAIKECEVDIIDKENKISELNSNINN